MSTDAQEAMTQFEGAHQLGQGLGAAAQAHDALGRASRNTDNKEWNE